VSAAGTLLEKLEATDLELKVKSSKAAPYSSNVGEIFTAPKQKLSTLPLTAQAAAAKGRAGTDNDADNPELTPPAETPAANRRRGPEPDRDSRTRFVEVVGLDSTLVQHRSQIRSGRIRSEHRTAPAAPIAFWSTTKGSTAQGAWDPGPSTPATWSGHSGSGTPRSIVCS
jgi:hypothetical protein